MDDQLRLLIGANASTKLYCLALRRRNEGGATCPFTLNLPIAIRTLRNELIPAFHNHPAVGADGLARVADELQVVSIGPGSAGARHAGPQYVSSTMIRLSVPAAQECPPSKTHRQVLALDFLQHGRRTKIKAMAPIHGMISTIFCAKLKKKKYHPTAQAAP